MLRKRDAELAPIRAANEARRKKEEVEFQAMLAAKQAEAKARFAEKALMRCREAREKIKAASAQSMCFQDRTRLVKSVSDWNPETRDFQMPSPTHPECTEESPHHHCRTCGCTIPVDVFVARLSGAAVGLLDAAADFAPDFAPAYPDLCANWLSRARFEEFILRSGWGTKASCEKCKDGWIVTGDKSDLSSCGLRLCDCWVKEKLGENLKEFWDASLTNFSPPIRKAVGAWFDNLEFGLFLTGNAGIGKTHLAIAIFKVVYLQWGWRDALYRRCNDVYEQIRKTFSRSEFDWGQPSEEKIVKELCACPLLVLDDVATGNGKEFEQRILLGILDRRRNGKRITVVVSNFGLAKIAEHFNEPREAERITSRIAGLKEMPWSGPDRRLRLSSGGPKG